MRAVSEVQSRRNGQCEADRLRVSRQQIRSDADRRAFLRTTYAIIGSGVTACSVAKNLLEDPRSGADRVTTFEARTLCSGATGRTSILRLSLCNVNHMAADCPVDFR